MDIQNNKDRQSNLYIQLVEKNKIIKKLQMQQTLLTNDSKQLDMVKRTAYTTNQHNKYLQTENKELESKLAVLKDVDIENVKLLKNITILINENKELRIELEKLNNDIDRIVNQLRQDPLF